MYNKPNEDLYTLPTSFPRWGAEDGIPLKPVLDYMAALSEFEEPLYNHSRNFPEATYIVSREGIRVNGDSFRRTHMAARYDRWAPTHKMFFIALDILTRGGASQAASRWPTLHNAVFNGGFPFVLFHGDNRKCNHDNWKNRSLPVFTYSAPLSCNYTLPFPTYHIFLHSKPSSAAWGKTSAERARKYPWASKKRQVIWRGTLWTDLPRNAESTRHRLLRRVTAHPQDTLDIRTTQVMDTRDFTPQTEEDRPLAEYGGIAEKMKMDDFQNYTAVLDLDGLSWSSRFVTLLCYNSVVLKVNPEHVDFFHFDLQPWIHYIPVREDLSDLEEKAAFATDPANDGQVLRIIANANAWCHSRVVETALAEDLLGTWNFYVEQLYKNDPHWQERWNKVKRANHVRYAHSMDAKDLFEYL